MTTEAGAGWWTRFFDFTYAEFGLVPASEEDENRREQAADFLAQVLRFQPGQTVLDQCCGVGRMSIPVARRGVRVIGVDLAAGYADAARAAAEKEQLDCAFYAADAFEFVAPEPCEAAFNWFTSFGYHRDDRENVRMLARAFESLVPGGRFALDYVSVPRVFRVFHGHPAAHQRGEVWVIEEPAVDFEAGMIRTRWTFLHPDGRRETRRVEIRTYMPNELMALLRQAGFSDLELFGSTAGEPFDRLSRRLIVAGRRPGSS